MIPQSCSSGRVASRHAAAEIRRCWSEPEHGPPPGALCLLHPFPGPRGGHLLGHRGTRGDAARQATAPAQEGILAGPQVREW